MNVDEKIQNAYVELEKTAHEMMGENSIIECVGDSFQGNKRIDAMLDYHKYAMSDEKIRIAICKICNDREIEEIEIKVNRKNGKYKTVIKPVGIEEPIILLGIYKITAESFSYDRFFERKLNCILHGIKL